MLNVYFIWFFIWLQIKRFVFVSFFLSLVCCCCSSAFYTTTNFIVVYFINASTLLTAPHNIIHETHLWLQLIAMTVCYGLSPSFSVHCLRSTPSACTYAHSLFQILFFFLFLVRGISAGGHRSFCVMYRKAY